MKLKNAAVITLSLAFILFSTTGCDFDQAQKVQREQDSMINTQLINTYNDIALQNAIITQHTLYPYHFVNNSEKLNDLGIRDFGILARHFTENPGDLNVNKGDASAELYQKRVDMVSQMLRQAGVDVNRIQIADGMPGGDGVTTERMLKILKKAETKPESDSGSGQSMFETGASSGLGIGTIK